MVRGLNIAVAGAGIGGLSAAALLARQGNTVTIFDKFETPRPKGSGLMLQQTGLAVLDELGLREEIDRLGSRIDRLWGLSTPSYRTVLDVRYSAWNEKLYGLGVQRSLVFNQLLKAALDAGAELVPETHIRRVDLASGALIGPNGVQIGQFDLIVDALGVRSPLTQNPRRDLPYGALWATMPWPEDGPFDASTLEQRYRAADKMAGVMASGRATPSDRETLTYFWSIRAEQEAGWRANPLDAWKQEAKALWPDTEMLLDQITTHDDMAFARYRHRTHPTPVSGPHLVHVGDAWHAASPQLGQGANMALLDAWALSVAFATNDAIPSALHDYKTLRRRHVQIYQWMTWAFTPVYQGDSRVLPWMRDWLAAPLSRIPPAPRLLAAMVSGAIGQPLSKLGLHA